jgi:hypothetical protein
MGVVAGLFLAALFSSWINSTEINTVVPAVDTFIYEFHEPMNTNNTNYKITVTPSKIYFSIDAFGKVVYTDAVRLSLKKYNEFVKALTALHITSRQRTDGPCVGTVTQYFQFYAGTSKQLKGMYNTCSPGFSNLAGDLPAAAALFQALIPGLEKKLDKIREEQSGNE